MSPPECTSPTGRDGFTKPRPLSTLNIKPPRRGLFLWQKVNDSNMGVSPSVPSPKIIPESDVYRLVMRSNLPVWIDGSDSRRGTAKKMRQESVLNYSIKIMFVKPLKKVGQSGRKKWNALWAFRRRGENSGGKSRFFVGAQRFFRGEFLLFPQGDFPGKSSFRIFGTYKKRSAKR